MKLLSISYSAVSLFVVSLAFPLMANAASYRIRSSDVHVKSYFKSNGTYVPSYYRSKADGIKSNNYGTKYRW